MPQFYNGATRPAIDGVDKSGAGALSAAVMFSSLANDMFDSEPNKVSSKIDRKTYFCWYLQSSQLIFSHFLQVVFGHLPMPGVILWLVK